MEVRETAIPEVKIIIPKIFGVKDIRIMAVIGIVFLLLTTLLGAFAFTAPLIEDNEEDAMDGDFSGLTVIESGDHYTVSVKYSGTATGDMLMYTPTVGTTSYKVISYRTDTEPLTMAYSGWLSKNAASRSSRSGRLISSPSIRAT